MIKPGHSRKVNTLSDNMQFIKELQKTKSQHSKQANQFQKTLIGSKSLT